MRKLFKGGNYSRAETIRGNTVFISVIYLNIFYEIGLLTHNVIKYVLILLQRVLIGNLLPNTDYSSSLVKALDQNSE